MGKPTGRPVGRPKGSRHKKTIERENAERADLAEAAALLVAGFAPSDFADVRAVSVMRMAMVAHLKLGNLDKAAVWAEKLAAYESPRLAAATVSATVSVFDSLSLDQRRLLDAALGASLGRAVEDAGGEPATHH